MPKSRRDWTHARAKVEVENKCRVCGRDPGRLAREGLRLEAAHTIGRGRDWAAAKQKPGSATTVRPGDIVPLCGPATTTSTCHSKYDRHQLDLLPYLTEAEQVAAVEAAGGIEKARRRLTGERL